jgi:hypothetical protein
MKISCDVVIIVGEYLTFSTCCICVDRQSVTLLNMWLELVLLVLFIK